MGSILIVDVETTGLDPKTDRIVEVGAVLYSVQHRCIVEQWASLVDTGSPNTAEAINRIPSSALVGAPLLDEVLQRLNGHLGYPNRILMAHRAEFDRSFLDASGFDSMDTPWVCSKFDVEWPLSKPGASCVEMALAHGVPVVSAHRALTDCMLIAKTLEAVQALGHDLPAMLARAMRPKAMFRANVSYDDRELAKTAGFHWEPASKSWLRRMAKDDTASLAFPVSEVPA